MSFLVASLGKASCTLPLTAGEARGAPGSRDATPKRRGRFTRSEGRIARMPVFVRPMSLEDLPDVLDLWRRTEGIGLSESDSAPAIASFFARNPDLSPVALTPEGRVVAAVLCGHDGRRGYLHHLAVDADHRKQGIAAELVGYCLDRLAALGILKCNVFLFRDNVAGAEFWRHNGWSPRDDLRVFQKVLE
jgi:ribosomal protein S18 acetylase RimI-like enzyme